MLRLAFAVATRREMYGNGFAVLINGGAYQDVAQAHIHLAGLDAGLHYAAPTSRPALPLLEEAGLVAFEHPEPRRAVHVAIVPSEHLAWGDLAGPAGVRLGEAIVGVGQRLVARYGLASAGFTLLASIRPGGERDAVCFHLVGGARHEPEGAQPERSEQGAVARDPGRSSQRPD